jgi:signal peptidase II
MPNVRWIILSTTVIIADQLTKSLAELYLTPLHSISIFPFLDLTLRYNTGAAFSLLHNAGGWQRYLFITITCIALIILYRWLLSLSTTEKLLSVGLSLIIGGAIGNLIDRIITGEVIDFISVHYMMWYWPAFNIADTAISIGISLLLLDSVLTKPETNS